MRDARSVARPTPRHVGTTERSLLIDSRQSPARVVLLFSLPARYAAGEPFKMGENLKTALGHTLHTGQFLIVSALVVISVSAPSAIVQPRGLTMAVRAVPDGDTIRVGGRRVNLLGIKAPRFDPYNPEPFGREARDRLSSLVILRYVRLEYDGQPRGRAYVFTEDGIFVNAEIVRAGLARVTGPTTLKRLDALRAAEVEARNARRGIWGAAPTARP